MNEYIVINNTNLLDHYGLHLLDYSVGAPEPDVKLIDVPGRPGKLDATLALNGKVNFKTRPITIKLHSRNKDYEDFHDILSELTTQVNGTESHVTFSTDPGWYYKGRFTVTYSKTNPVTAVVTLTCKNAFPYKLDNSMDWSFDPTVFGTTVYACDRIVHANDVVANRYAYTGYEFNGRVTIYTDRAMELIWNNRRWALQQGKNYLPEVRIDPGHNMLQFDCDTDGRARVHFDRGVQ